MKKHGGRKKIQPISTLKTCEVDFQMGDFMYERAKRCALYVGVEPKSYYISGTCVAAVGRFSNFYSLHSDIHRFLNQGCALGSRGRMDDNSCKLENMAIKKCWKYLPLKVLFTRTRNFLIKPNLTADSKSNAKRKAMKIDNFACMVLVTQISGSAALDAIIDDSDCRGPLWDLIAGNRF